MTLQEKFDALAKGGDSFAVVFYDWGVGRHNHVVYPGTVVVVSMDAMTAGRKIEYEYGGLNRLHQTKEWAEIGKRRGYIIQKYPKLGGFIMEELVADCCISWNTFKNVPVYFGSNVKVDRFSGEVWVDWKWEAPGYCIGTDHRSHSKGRSDQIDRWIEFAYDRMGRPEFKYAILGDKPKSLNDLRERNSGSRRRFDPYNEHEFATDDLRIMYEFMGGKKTKITKEAVKRAARRYVKRVKKLTESEQGFFSMLLGAGSLKKSLK